MIHNIPPSPFSVEYDQYPQYPPQPTWEDYFLQVNHLTYAKQTPFIQDNGFITPEGPAPVSEIMFEKPIEAPSPMEMEEEYISYANENTFSPDCEFFSTMGEGDHFSEFPENYDELIARQAQQEAYNGFENTECSRCHSDEGEEQEEVGSISTMDSRFGESILDEVNSITNWENNSAADQAFDADNEINQMVMNYILQRSDEEKEYIQRVLPSLMSSIRQLQQAAIPLNDDIIGSILKDLVYQKELMIAQERNLLRGIIDDEMSALRASRPTEGIALDDLMVQKRKEKRADKGNRNTSSVNHFNENCASNIFQFAKRNYPQDKEVQRIGNERNVSATAFKKITKPTLNDDVFTRKAKARIAGNGQELIGNIQNWMNAGYFEQCADREKYILNKEKALRDLALSGQY